jgi:hypothetical protein
MIDPVIEISIRLALALLFAGAAWHKASNLHRFEAVVRGYHLLPAPWLPAASRLLPLVEAVLALGLVYGPSGLVAACGAATLLLIYAAAIAVNIVRGQRDIDCGCFASSSRAPLSPGLVGRNLGLTAASLLTLAPQRARTLVWIDWLTVGMTLIVLSLLWLASQRLAQTAPALRRLRGNR